MKSMSLEDYKINIASLGNNIHVFGFEFNNHFFSQFESSLLSKGKGFCSIELTKSNSMITLDFEIEGSLELICDRSLDIFYHPIKTSHRLIYKYGDEEKELNEDVFVITKDTQQIMFANHLYEFILLEIPMKKLHPRYEDEDSDGIFFRVETPSYNEDQMDPRWEALKNLK